MSVRTALVTGATRGIGLEVARRLAREGYTLTISARDAHTLGVVARDLRDVHRVPVNPVAADMSQESQIGGLVAAHTAFADQLDVLVLNAGFGSAGALADLSMRTYDRTMAVNLRSQVQLIQGCLPLLRAAAKREPARGAKVLALASITGVCAEDSLGAYGASKAALISLCQTLTAEEFGNGVTATAISPGYVDTDMTAWKRDTLDQASMLTTGDVAELVMAVTHLTAQAVVPNIVLSRAGQQIWRA
ncbi:SDR family oxidoreductase [Nocardia sp. NPDC004860]|uniref:SDR family NAD(P)-dependent oxidoreductase n=1 Tax=Nocardia sp. NPDC004860 TaxID=3154557 RepID=UPI0033B28462